MDDLLTVVIRTMPGREKFLDKCLFILSGQVHRNLEVLVVSQKLSDAASIAATEATIVRWGSRFSSLRLLSHVSATDARARSLNIGKRNAKGRYLAFLDDDDKVYPNHYNKLIESLQKTDYTWAYADIIRALYNEYGQLISRSSPFRRTGYSYLDHLRSNYIPIHSFVIDLQRATGVGEVDEGMNRNEDYEFILRLAFKHEPLYVPGFGAEYCIRNDGSNTVSDGTGDAKASALKRRLWNSAQDILDEKKIENLGWWVRELERLPAVYPHDPQQNDVNYAAVQMDLRHTVRADEGSQKVRNELRLIYGSKSWRIARKAHNALRRLRGQPQIVDVVPDNEDEAMSALHAVINSRSWDLMGLLRIARRAVSKGMQ